MNQTDIARVAKQQTMYRTEALAKRRNLAELTKVVPVRDDAILSAAITVNHQTMMLIRTEAKMRAIEELAEALGIAEQVAALVEGE